MKMRCDVGRLVPLFGTAFVGLFGLSRTASAVITVDGSLDVGYGGPLAVQTVNTGFGDSNYTGSPNGPDANGSELDAAYGVISGGNLNIFLAGNIENNGNHVNIFIADGRAGGQNTLGTGVGPISQMNGSVFSPGFNATYAVDVNDYQGTAYTDAADLVAGTGGYVGSVSLTSGIGAGAPSGGSFGSGLIVGLNNSNTAGVAADGGVGTPANQAAAAAVTTGVEVSIPLSLLGNPSGPIAFLADINGGGDGYLSNQFLPGLPPGTTDLGNNGQFNFSNTPGEYVVVGVPEPVTMGLLAPAVLTLLARRRRSTNA
jgi:hypothetical protein